MRYITLVLLFSVIFTPSALADCALVGNNPGTRPEGTVVFNADFGVLQGCRGTEWVALGPGVGGPTGCGNVGDVCSDGSVYAGLSPDGNVPMYTTSADAPSRLPWNNGTGNYIDTAMVNCTDAGTETSCQTGQSNTALLAGLSDAGSPYEAAVYCDNLTAHFKSDWYLPAQDELDVLFDNRAAIGAFDTSGGSFPASHYWSSSERSIGNARLQKFGDGEQTFLIKHNELFVRCVRT